MGTIKVTKKRQNKIKATNNNSNRKKINFTFKTKQKKYFNPFWRIIYDTPSLKYLQEKQSEMLFFKKKQRIINIVVIIM